MTKIDIFDSSELDFDSFVRLQAESFADIINKAGVGYLFTDSFYRWKYFPPSGNAKIAIVKDEAGLVAANSMYPVDLLIGKNRMRGWQSCDTATLPRGRGKGYFMQCIAALKRMIGEEEVFFGFPNHNSMRGFERLGWSKHSDIRTWLRVLPSFQADKLEAIAEVELFTTEFDIFAESLARQGGVTIARDAAYMNWRYKRHPLHQYKSYQWLQDGQLLGVLVMRRMRISGKELAVVMEVLALSGTVERGLLAFAAAWGRQHRAAYTLVINNTTGLLNAALTGYLPVPMCLLPKRQQLMGAAGGISSLPVWNEPWHVQIGDWDGF